MGNGPALDPCGVRGTTRTIVSQRQRDGAADALAARNLPQLK